MNLLVEKLLDRIKKKNSKIYICPDYLNSLTCLLFNQNLNTVAPLHNNTSFILKNTFVTFLKMCHNFVIPELFLMLVLWLQLTLRGLNYFMHHGRIIFRTGSKSDCLIFSWFWFQSMF